MKNDERGMVTDQGTRVHSAHGWRLDATDDFGAGVITFIAADLLRRETYDLDGLVISQAKLRELHGDLGDLLVYLEKGVSGPERQM